MLKLLSILVLFTGTLIGQTALISSNGTYQLGTITTVGQIGPTVVYGTQSLGTAFHSIQFAVHGTAPLACSLSLDGSLNGVDWVSISGPLSCTSSNMYHYGPKAVAYIRVNIIQYIPGDTTTSVAVIYGRG